MQRHLITLLALTLAALSTFSYADKMNARYGSADLGLGVGRGLASATDIFTEKTETSWLGASVDLGIGYQHSKWLGAEAGTIYLSDINVKNNNFRFNYFSFRAMLPIQERFNFILKVGTATDQSFNFATPFIGVGLGYHLNDHLSTRLIYQGATSVFASIGILSLGLNYQI